MLFNPQTGDIVLNFYRSKVYRFDNDNMQHVKDSSRCRFATFEEIQRFNKLNRDNVDINEILDLTVRNKNKWDKMQIPEITLKINDRLLSSFVRYSKDLKLNTYESIISEIFSINQSDFSKETELKKIKKDNVKLKAIMNEIKKVINNY